MHPRFTYWLALVLMLGMLAPTLTYATHVRAGEITTRRLPGDRLTYEITLTAYYDESPSGRQAADLAEEVPFCLGDGTTIGVRRTSRVYINNRTSSVNTYRFTYTYQGPGVYQISALLVNRNQNTMNLRQPSDQISFWIRTTIQVNAALGLNATPVLLNPPLDSARIGQKFCHNPVAFDIDGDSLAYRMAIPQEANSSGICRGFNVNGYRDPARGLDPNAQNETKNGPATLTINPLTGDLCWDSPAVAGQYNIAFIVEEWRDGVLIGEITRDMQIIVNDSKNNRPLLDPLPDLCREAGSLIQVPIRAYDPDGHRVEITAFGGIFNRNPDGTAYNPAIIAPPFATLVTPAQPQSGTATGTIRWQTACAHARTEDYDVLARVVDFPGRTANQLATLQSFRIRIIAPRPTGLTARPQVTTTGRAIRLSWNDYTCIPISTTGSVMVVYRREGCNPIPSLSCATGLSASAGYTQIGTVPIGTTTFVDTTTLRRGISYSYRIVARFSPIPLGGESVVSDQVCLELPLLAPLITQVTVDSTATQRGQITVRWTRPIGLNPADGGSPFQYRVFRATGLTGTAFTQITAITSALTPGVADTVYVDRQLDTEANAYRYRIDFYQTTNGIFTRVDAAEPASSPRLTLNAGLRQIELVWATNTPWSNDNQTHRVYRSRRGRNTPLELIAQVSVQAQPYRYTDTGIRGLLAGVRSLSLSVDSNYCYRVETIGSYTSTTSLGNRLLNNFSQIVCGSPSDTTR
ncbi:MAG: gliding motility-associated C-terminal domain-containing protein, partial [Rudanella sp.]|nr:gliding motility-associated C-terminal domain-containing protein [Rudanella sp.]